MDKTVLSVKNLRKSFSQSLFNKPKEILKSISFELRSGSISGFLGINGSGKTTTIKSILNLIAPDSGEVFYFGDQKLSKAIKKRIGYLPEKPQLYDHLTGYELLELSMKLSRGSLSSSPSEIERVLELVDLKLAQNFRLREYSKGMYQRIGLAQVIIRSPDFLILDEPMSDLDPAGRMMVHDILRRIQEERKVSIFFSSHLLQDIESLCEDIVILDSGRVHYYGDTMRFTSQLKPQYEIQYTDNVHRHSLIVESEKELQIKIDLLRKDQFKILRIQNKTSLERAFRELVGPKL